MHGYIYRMKRRVCMLVSLNQFLSTIQATHPYSHASFFLPVVCSSSAMFCLSSSSHRSCICHPHDILNIVFYITSFVFYHVVLSNNTLGYEGWGRHA